MTTMKVSADKRTSSNDDSSNSMIHPKLVISPSKAFPILFTKMRDINTTPKEFAFYAKRAMRILAEDAIAELPSKDMTITTPCGTFLGRKHTHDDPMKNVCAVSIIRGGDALLESVLECLPGIPVGKILIQRNESSATKEAISYYSKLPPKVKDMEVLLCDPMLATSGSAREAIRILVEEYGVREERIVFVNLISCPEGLGVMAEVHPDVTIVTACVDEGLNEEKYIVPGLGDFGDRFFNSV